MVRPKKVSQTQLAEELGISQALVSLVLNGRRQGINPETYSRIWAHAAKRGYHPKGMRLAAAPATQPSQVAVILRAPLRLHTPSRYFGHVQQGLHASLETQGFTPVFMGAEDQLTVAKLHRLFFPGHRFHGIVLLGEVARPFLDLLRELNMRIVAVSAQYPGLCHSVLGDEPHALASLVQHLRALGHRRIGWLGGNVGLGRHEARFTAFKTALAREELSLDPRYCIKLTQGDRAEGSEAAHAVLAHAGRKDFPTAFICYNGLMADGALKTFARAGRRVPDDLSLASADVSPAALNAKPCIAAAGSCPEKLGEAAGRLVLENPGDDVNFTDLIVPAQLFPGDTTGRIPRQTEPTPRTALALGAG